MPRIRRLLFTALAALVLAILAAGIYLGPKLWSLRDPLPPAPMEGVRHEPVVRQ